MLSYNEIKEKKYIILDGDPYEVIDSHVFRKQQRKPVNQTKLRNLINGSIKQQTFHNNDTVEEADLSKKKVLFAFTKPNRQAGTTEYWFIEPEDRSKRFNLDESILSGQTQYLKENLEVEALVFDEKVIGITLPIKVDYKVKSAPPAVKGNSATGATKQVTLESGLIVNTPLFVNENDIVVVNTQTGEYVERK